MLYHSLLLATLASSHLATAQQSPASAPSPDVADTFRLAQLPLPGVDTQAEWSQLLQHARDVARAEYEEKWAAEREERERRTSGGEVRTEGGIKVVRESFYLPYETPRTGGEGTSPAAVSVGATNSVVSPSQLPEEAADIVKTVGKLRALRPLFTYAIHHPLRFLLRYALIPLLRSILFVLSIALSVVVYLLLSILSPLQLILSVLFSPLTSFINFNLSILPLWGMLAGALVAGGGLGAVAGLVAGRTTREVIDEAAGAAKKSLTWLGVLEKPVVEQLEPKKDAFGAEARMETLSSVFGSSRAKSQAAKAARAKKTTPGATSTSPGSTFSSLPFNSITPHPSRPSAPSAFSTATSASLKSSFPHRKQSRQPAFPLSLAAEDPPSEELDLRKLAGGKRGEFEEEVEEEGSKVAGWRDRKVRL